MELMTKLTKEQLEVLAKAEENRKYDARLFRQGRQLRPEEVGMIKGMYLIGKTQKEISDATGISIYIVSRTMKQFDEKTKEQRRLLDEAKIMKRNEEIVKLYADGHTILEVVKLSGYSYPTVVKILEEAKTYNKREITTAKDRVPAQKKDEFVLASEGAINF